jgi:predicted double-glycine peptidase
LAAQEQVVGENLVFTVTGAALMALVTYWTLNTLGDALEVIALRVRHFRH